MCWTGNERFFHKISSVSRSFAPESGIQEGRTHQGSIHGVHKGHDQYCLEIPDIKANETFGSQFRGDWKRSIRCGQGGNRRGKSERAFYFLVLKTFMRIYIYIYVYTTNTLNINTLKHQFRDLAVTAFEEISESVKHTSGITKIFRY